jgi:hypothetical protein
MRGYGSALSLGLALSSSLLLSGCSEPRPTVREVAVPPAQLTQVELFSGDIYWGRSPFHDRGEAVADVFIQNQSDYTLTDAMFTVRLISPKGEVAKWPQHPLYTKIPPGESRTVQIHPDLPRNLARSNWSLLGDSSSNGKQRLVLQTGGQTNLLVAIDLKSAKGVEGTVPDKTDVVADANLSTTQ